MNKKFVPFIAVVILIGVGFFILTKQDPKPFTPIVVSTPPASPSATTEKKPTIDTSNWKTYTNTTYNYSIRLPSTYPDNSEKNIDQSSGELDLKMVTSSVWVAVWKNSGNLTTDEWLKESGNMVGKNTYPAQKTTFNGYDALVSNRGQSTNWYFISHGNYIYEVEDNETIGTAPTFKPTQQQIQDQKEILSTFKFTQ